MDDKKLTLEELKYVQKEVANKEKSITVAYLFAIFLGFLGIHRAYFGKKKTAILKGLVTLLATTTLFQIMDIMSSIDMNSELTMAIMTTNAAVAVSFIGLFSIGILWYFADLFLIPKWKKDWDNVNKTRATLDAIQGRHVSTQLIRNQLSEEIVEGAKIQAIQQIEEILLKLDKKELNTLRVPSIPIYIGEEKEETESENSEDEKDMASLSSKSTEENEKENYNQNEDKDSEIKSEN